MPLSVNLRASSLADARLPEQLDGLMRQYRLPSSCLMLELTETMVMRDGAPTIGVLARLRSMGFGLSLDDFGTGYSSLSYLKRLPMSELKIDRAFITDVTRGGRDAALAVVIVSLGSELGPQVVAEGVETQEQSAFLIGRRSMTTSCLDSAFRRRLGRDEALPFDRGQGLLRWGCLPGSVGLPPHPGM